MRWETDQAGNAATRKSLDLNSALIWIRTSQTFALLQTLPFVRNAEGWKKGQDWPEVEEAEGGEGSDEEAGEDDRVGSPCHQLPPPEEHSFQAEKWQLFSKCFQKTISDDDIILDHDDDIPADDEPTGRVHRTHGFCEEVDSRSVKVLALIFLKQSCSLE